MGTFEEQIAFNQSQIEVHKKSLLDAEYSIKIWRVLNMIDKLFLWYEITQNFSLYNKQYNRLKDIQIQLKKQYKQQN